MNVDPDTLFALGAAAAAVAAGWRSVSKTAQANTQRLGANLGPRVQELGERVARIEGRLGIKTTPESGTMEGGDRGS